MSWRLSLLAQLQPSFFWAFVICHSLSLKERKKKNHCFKICNEARGSSQATPLQSHLVHEVSETNFLSDQLAADKKDKPALQVCQGELTAGSYLVKHTSFFSSFRCLLKRANHCYECIQACNTVCVDEGRPKLPYSNPLGRFVLLVVWK